MDKTTAINTLDALGINPLAHTVHYTVRVANLLTALSQAVSDAKAELTTASLLSSYAQAAQHSAKAAVFVEAAQLLLTELGATPGHPVAAASPTQSAAYASPTAASEQVSGGANLEAR